MREGEKPKTPRHASVAASRDDRLPYSRHLFYNNIILKDFFLYKNLRFNRFFL